MLSFNKKKNAAILVLIILVAACIWLVNDKLLERGNTITATGTIEATSVSITTRLAGPIIEIYFSENDKITKGDLVAEQERNDLSAQRERDALALTKAETALRDLLSGAQTEEIDSAQSAVNIALKKVETAEADYMRIKALYEQGGCSKVEYEKYETQYEVSKNELQSAESNLSLVKSGARNTQIDIARTEVKRCTAIFTASDAILSDLKLYSPISGTLITKNYEIGEYVQPGTPIFTVANLEDLWIKVYVPTDDLPKIELGQQVTFTVSGIDTVFDGTVKKIADTGEFTPKTIQTKKERTNIVFQVEIEIGSSNGILKPGMPADVVFNAENQH